MSTIYGGNSDDFVQGTNSDDPLYGFACDDRLQGGIGSDTLFGGAGNHVIYEINISNNVFLLSSGTEKYFGSTVTGEGEGLCGRVVGEAVTVELSSGKSNSTGGSATFVGFEHVKRGPFDDFKTKCIGLSRHVNFSGDRSVSTVVSGA